MSIQGAMYLVAALAIAIIGLGIEAERERLRKKHENGKRRWLRPNR